MTRVSVSLPDWLVKIIDTERGDVPRSRYIFRLIQRINKHVIEEDIRKMAEKLCIYCHKVTLEGFDETERKYYEKGSKTLHTRERCEAAKRGEHASETKAE